MGIIRALSSDKRIRIYYADVRSSVAEMAKIHNLNNFARAFLGETAAATMLLSADIGEESSKYSAVLRIPEVGSAVLIRTSPETVKGYSTAKRDGEFDFAKDIQNKAEFTVIIDIGTKVPYMTKIAVTEGTMRECLEFYFEQSQQQKSVVRLGEGENAVGVLLQPVLNSEFDYVKERADELNKMLDDAVKAGGDEAVKALFIAHGFDVTEYTDVKTECDCNSYQMEDVILSLGKKGAYEIVRDMGTIEITCPYCLKKYNFDGNAVEELFNE